MSYCEDDICPICLEEIDWNIHIYLRLDCTCKQKYHKDCVLPWLRTKGTCAYCRSPTQIKTMEGFTCVYFPENLYDPCLDMTIEQIHNIVADMKIEIKPLSEIIVK